MTDSHFTRASHTGIKPTLEGEGTPYSQVLDNLDFLHTDTDDLIEQLVPNSIRAGGFTEEKDISLISIYNPFELDPAIRNNLLTKERKYNDFLQREADGEALTLEEMQECHQLKAEVTDRVRELQGWRHDPAKAVMARFVGTVLFGACAYGWANKTGSEFMSGYEYDYQTGEVSFGQEGIDKSAVLGGGLQTLAWSLDSTLGRGLVALTGSENSCWFREPWVRARGKGFGTDVDGVNGFQDKVERGLLDGDRLALDDTGWAMPGGRGLGHEWVGVTFDFANMTLWSYIINTAMDAFDPYAKRPFIAEDGSFKPEEVPEWLFDRTVKGVVTVGQEWAAGIPYIMMTKSISMGVDNHAPGFYIDTSPNFNAASVVADRDGNIIDHYGPAGMAEFWLRFDSYNQLTHRYRKAVSHIESGALVEDFEKWKESGFKFDLGEALAEQVKWQMRETLKTSMFMAGSLPFYVMTRNPQRRDRAAVVVADDERGHGPQAIMDRDPETGKVDYRPVREQIKLNSDVPLTDREAGYRSFEIWRKDMWDTDAYKGLGMLRLPMEAIWEGTGKASYWTQNAVADTYKSLGWPAENDATVERWAQDQTQAALAYGPYLAVKTELIRKLDTDEWDERLDNFLSPVFNAVDYTLNPTALSLRDHLETPRDFDKYFDEITKETPSNEIREGQLTSRENIATLKKIYQSDTAPTDDHHTAETPRDALERIYDNSTSTPNSNRVSNADYVGTTMERNTRVPAFTG